MVVSVFAQQLIASKRQRLVTILALPVVVLMIHGVYRMAHLELWLWGAKRHLYQVPTTYLMPRLDAATRVQVLTEGKGIHLAQSLLQQPQHKNSNWWWLLAATDPTSAAQYALSQEDGAYYLLRELSAYPKAHPRLQACAALLGEASYSTLYEIANEDHEALGLLLPVEQYHDLLSSILERLNPPPPSEHVRRLPPGLWQTPSSSIVPEYAPGSGWPARCLCPAPTPPTGEQTNRRLEGNDPARHAAWTLQAFRKASP